MTQEQIDGTVDSFKKANFFWLALSLGFGFIANFLRTQRWRLMFIPLNYYPRYWNTFFSVNVMFFANLFIPRLGEVSRCGILAKYEGIPVEKSIGTMVVERIIDLICLFILIGLLLIVEYDVISNYFFELFSDKQEVDGPGYHWLIKYGIPLAIVLSITIISFIILRKHGIAQLKRTLRQRLRGLSEGLMSIRHMKSFTQFILLTIGTWLCYFIMIYVAFFSLPETSSLAPFSALACLIFGSFAMIATPGGIGAYPLAIRAVLLLYGINEVVGGALGTMIWGIQTGGVFIAGLISLALLSIMNPPVKIKA